MIDTVDVDSLLYIQRAARMHGGLRSANKSLYRTRQSSRARPRPGGRHGGEQIVQDGEVYGGMQQWTTGDRENNAKRAMECAD